MNDLYMVFYGERFYPSGGWKDLSDSFKTLEECIEHIKLLDSCCAWAQVVYNGSIILEAVEEGSYKNSGWKLFEVEEE